MRLLLAIFAIGCGGAPPVAPVAPPAPKPAVCPDTVAPTAPDPRRDAIARELEQVDRELDVIDDALIASEKVSGQSREAAVAAAMELRAARFEVSEVPRVEEPFLLSRARAAYFDAKGTVVELERDYGPRNVEMVKARERVDRRARDYADQRDVELAFARTETELLLKLPPSSRPADIVAWRRRALALMTPEIRERGRVPSASPANVLAAAMELDDLRVRRDELAAELGPRHPEMVAADARMTAAVAKLRDALGELLPATTAAPPVDATMVSRRAMLANRARALREQLR